jgi:hypothetical protein
MKDPCLRASPRHGGQGVFFEYDFCYLLTNKLNAHGGFIPAAVAPPNAITPNRKYLISYNAVRYWGQVLHLIHHSRILYFLL